MGRRSHIKRRKIAVEIKRASEGKMKDIKDPRGEVKREAPSIMYESARVHRCAYAN